MKHILLIGAGFSKNWGGWLSKEVFEYLLGCKEIQQNTLLKALLWRSLENKTGFENVLAILNQEFKTTPSIENKNQLKSIENCIIEMFKEMNEGFSKDLNWDENHDLTRNFLTRFDGIFSLNQDLLLEHHYISDNIMLINHGSKKWLGASLPGVERIAVHDENPSAILKPTSKEFFTIAPNHQPIIKLHGSSNWVSGDQKRVLILGGDKIKQLSNFELLNWYYQLFSDHLCQGSKLMIIGYGFQDEHINQAIQNGIENGLKILVSLVLPFSARL